MMGELFENIFVLVPVALIIFLRVFADGARKRSEKARQAATEANPEPARPLQGTKPTSRTATPGTREALPGTSGWAAIKEQRQAARKQQQEKQEKERQARSARPARRDLLGRLRNYLSGSLDQLADQPEPLHFEEESQRRLGQYGTQTAGSLATRAKVTSGYKEGFAGALEESPAIMHEPAALYAFPKRLERLSPLKRAIVLSEVLGKPKSLQQEGLQQEGQQ